MSHVMKKKKKKKKQYGFRTGPTQKRKVEELYFPCSENKDADQLHSYCQADLHLCF